MTDSIGLHLRRRHGYEAATVACNRPADLADEHRRVHARRPHDHDVDDLSSEAAVVTVADSQAAADA